MTNTFIIKLKQKKKRLLIAISTMSTYNITFYYKDYSIHLRTKKRISINNSWILLQWTPFYQFVKSSEKMMLTGDYVLFFD